MKGDPMEYKLEPKGCIKFVTEDLRSANFMEAKGIGNIYKVMVKRKKAKKNIDNILRSIKDPSDFFFFLNEEFKIAANWSEILEAFEKKEANTIEGVQLYNRLIEKFADRLLADAARNALKYSKIVPVK